MVAAVGVGVGGAGCRSEGTGAGGGGPSSACGSDQVRVAVEEAAGAGGHIGLRVRVDNPSEHGCALSGYPRVRLLDAQDRVMVTASEGNGSLTGTREPVGVVSLPPGGHALFIVEWSDVAVADDPCPAGVGLGITLPGARREVLVEARSVRGLAIAPCGDRLAVSPILPAAP